MEILQVINMDLLHTYSNIDFSTIYINRSSCHIIAKLGYNKLSMLIDIFDDVNKCEHIESPEPDFTLADYILYIINNDDFKSALTNEQQMKILFKLLIRDFVENSGSCFNPNEYYLYNIHKSYFNKYYNTIINLLD